MSGPDLPTGAPAPPRDVRSTLPVDGYRQVTADRPTALVRLTGTLDPTTADGLRATLLTRLADLPG
ncbi:hypothetical protein ACFQ0D_30140, partial [Micromonospora zhanjiangensis]